MARDWSRCPHALRQDSRDRRAATDKRRRYGRQQSAGSEINGRAMNFRGR